MIDSWKIFAPEWVWKALRWAIYAFLVVIVILSLNWIFTAWSQFWAFLAGIGIGCVAGIILGWRYRLVGRLEQLLDFGGAGTR